MHYKRDLINNNIAFVTRNKIRLIIIQCTVAHYYLQLFTTYKQLFASITHYALARRNATPVAANVKEDSKYKPLTTNNSE